MFDISMGDLLFIGLILCVVHGIMAALGYVRRRQAQRRESRHGGE